MAGDAGAGERENMTPFQRIRHAAIMGRGCQLDADEVQTLVLIDKDLLIIAGHDDRDAFSPTEEELNRDAPKIEGAMEPAGEELEP